MIQSPETNAAKIELLQAALVMLQRRGEATIPPDVMSRSPALFGDTDIAAVIMRELRLLLAERLTRQLQEEQRPPQASPAKAPPAAAVMVQPRPAKAPSSPAKAPAAKAAAAKAPPAKAPPAKAPSLRGRTDVELSRMLRDFEANARRETDPNLRARYEEDISAHQGRAAAER